MPERFETGARAWLRGPGAALALATLFCFSGLGSSPLRASDEPRVAGIAWTMQHEGRWLVPWLSDRPFLEHPPLAYALIGASLAAFGATETAARLPGALASLATLWLVFALGRRLAGARAGLTAMLLLVGVNGFFRYSHRVLVDPVLAACAMLGYFAYVHAAWPEAQGDADARAAAVPAGPVLGLYAAAALAFLVKGPVGLVLIGGPIAWDVLAFRGLRFARSWGHAVGALLLAATCVGWLASLRHVAGDAALESYLVQNGLLRIVPSAGAGAYTGGHVRGWWFYLPRFPGLLGWTALLLPALVAWMRRGEAGRQGRGGALRFLALVFPIGLLLLSIPGTKRTLYLLPLAAPLAVPLGAWCAAMAQDDPRRSRVESATARLCALAVRLLCWPLEGLLVALGRLWPRARRTGLALGARVQGDLQPGATGPRRGPLRVAAIVYAASVAWNLLAYPHLDRHRDLGPLSRELVARSGPGPFVGYRLDEDIRGAIPFYTGKIVIDLDSQAELARYLKEHPDRAILVGGKHTEAPGGAPLRVVWRASAYEGTYTLVRAEDSAAN